MGVMSPSRCGGRYPEATLHRHPAADRGTPAIAPSITGVTGPVVMRFSKTRGELCLEESEIDILGRQRADITALADHQRHFCRGLILQLVPVCANLSLNRTVIRWMPDYLNLGGAKC